MIIRQFSPHIGVVINLFRVDNPVYNNFLLAKEY